jgi:16S rRNA U1498 N3-methylase RsmE
MERTVQAVLEHLKRGCTVEWVDDEFRFIRYVMRMGEDGVLRLREWDDFRGEIEREEVLDEAGVRERALDLLRRGWKPRLALADAWEGACA